MRNRAERLLRESEERFRLLIEGVKDYAIVMLDPHGRVATWNQGATRINGYTAEEIVGRHFSRFYTAEDRAQKGPERQLAEAIERRGGSRKRAGAYARTDRASGPMSSSRPVRTRRRLARIRQGHARHDRAQAGGGAGGGGAADAPVPRDARPRAAQPARAHPQRGGGHAHARDRGPADRVLPRTSSSGRSTHLARLVDDLLDASRITTRDDRPAARAAGPRTRGHARRRSEPAELREPKPRAHHRAATREPIEVSGDQTRLVQVVQNLLNNAAKYTPRGGNISLSM